MFGNRYFPLRYFPDRYFPQGGAIADVETPVTTVNFTITGSITFGLAV